MADSRDPYEFYVANTVRTGPKPVCRCFRALFWKAVNIGCCRDTGQDPGKMSLGPDQREQPDEDGDVVSHVDRSERLRVGERDEKEKKGREKEEERINGQLPENYIVS